MSNGDELLSGHKPPVRQRVPGELLFSFRAPNHRQVDCELRDHGEYGVEVQFYIDREFRWSMRFQTRVFAEAWAEAERARILASVED